MSLATNVADLATRIATEFKSVRTSIATLSSTVSALINDTTTSSSSTWSSSKISSHVSTAVAGLVAGAPGTLDTLDELAAALGDDSNFAASTATALGNRVRVDTAAQGLSSTQQSNARTNINAASATDLGDPATNYVTVFEAGLL